MNDTIHIENDCDTFTLYTLVLLSDSTIFTIDDGNQDDAGDIDDKDDKMKQLCPLSSYVPSSPSSPE
jgi:hypothetical protein